MLYWRRMERDPLTPKAQSMYQYLLYRANLAFWEFPVRVRMTAIEDACHISRTAAKEARGELTDRGLIFWEPGGGNAAARYWICDFKREGKSFDDMEY